MSNSYYEDILIPNEGIAVKMGVSNSFQDDFYYAAHIYDFKTANPDVVEASGAQLILIHSLYKRVVEPVDKYLDIYGSMIIDIEDLSALYGAIEKVANNLKCGLYHKPYYIVNEATKLDKSQAMYGGEILYGKSRAMYIADNKSEIRDEVNIIFTVHEWYDRYSNDFDILITSWHKKKYSDVAECHDYDSVFIRLGHEEKFIAALQQMKERIESSVSLPKNS